MTCRHVAAWRGDGLRLAATVNVSIYFLWVVRSLHRNSLHDWNRRPLVGRASRQSRPSPWAAT